MGRKQGPVLLGVIINTSSVMNDVAQARENRAGIVITGLSSRKNPEEQSQGSQQQGPALEDSQTSILHKENLPRNLHFLISWHLTHLISTHTAQNCR